MRIVFMGSAELACPSLEVLMASEADSVVGVVTQPDRPKGRRLHVSPCAAKAAATALGVPVLTPANVNAPESLQALRALHPELIVVVAYGQFLRRPLLELPEGGCINVHASLLPAYRGAAPIQWAIANGERETGVTIMHMNERMDEGDIILQRRVSIGDDETAGELHDRLAEAGAQALVSALDALREGRAERRAQDEARATYAPKLKKGDGRIDWTQPAALIHNRVRGFNPWPGCFCRCRARGGDAILKVLRGRVATVGGDPGKVVALSDDGPLVAAGEGSVCLVTVQPEGKRPMSGADYLRGHGLSVGEELGA